MTAIGTGIDAATRQRLEATLHALETDRGASWPLLIGIAASVMFHSALLVPQVREFFAHVNDGIDRSRQAAFSLDKEMEKRAPLTPEQQQQEQEDMIRLGIEDGAQQSTMTWIGYKEYQEHLARLSSVEQAAFRDTDEGGQPMPAARPATPQVPQTPQAQPAAPPAPDTTSTPPGEPSPGPASAAQPTPPPTPSSQSESRPIPAQAEPTPPATAAPPPPAPAETRPAPTPERPPAPLPDTSATRETAPTKDPTAIPIPSADENRVEPTIQPVERAPDKSAAKDPSDAPPPPQAEKPQDVPPAKPEEAPQPNAKPAEPTPPTAQPAPPQPAQPAPQPPQPPQQQPRPPAATPPTQTAPGLQQPSTSPTTGPSPDPSARPGAKPGPKADGELSDRESDATSVKASPPRDWKPGKPLAQQGLELRTVRPEIDELTAISGRPMSALALIEFNRAGKVVNVTLLEPTGLRSWDQALEDSLYRWTAVTAKSAKLRNLPADKTLKFTIRLLLN